MTALELLILLFVLDPIIVGAVTLFWRRRYPGQRVSIMSVQMLVLAVALLIAPMIQSPSTIMRIPHQDDTEPDRSLARRGAVETAESAGVEGGSGSHDMRLVFPTDTQDWDRKGSPFSEEGCSVEEFVVDREDMGADADAPEQTEHGTERAGETTLVCEVLDMALQDHLLPPVDEVGPTGIQQRVGSSWQEIGTTGP